MKKNLKSILAMTPYRVLRRTAINRFQANSETLQTLRDRGFQPAFVIDGGANVGDFARETARHFPAARFELIEPQPGCKPRLDTLSKVLDARVHPCALTSDSETHSIHLRTDASQTSTGAHVVDPDAPDQSGVISVPAITLDALFGGKWSPDQRGLLKLDLQGFELEALRGGMNTLVNIDVILIEVSFYRLSKEPSIAELIAFLSDAGFELHDIASISARQRDNRAYQADFLFVRAGSLLTKDTAWQ